MAHFDVIVVGLGAIGSAALYRLARRGVRTFGIDRFVPGHDRGSSHGETRMIRLGYFEHPSYVPLLREAYRLWRELEAQWGSPLLTVTGILEIGAPESSLVRGTLESSRLHGLPHEILDSGALMRRFPAYRLPGDFVGVHQPDGGFLAAERSIEVNIALARASGADVHTHSIVERVEAVPDRVRIVSSVGTFEAGAAVIAAGPWLKKLIPDVPAPVRVTRQVLAWFEPTKPALFEREGFPVFLIESELGVHYGFPLDDRQRVKFAKHHHRDEPADPDAEPRPCSATDEADIRVALAAFLPAANGPLAEARTCLYTVTPDHDFIIDRLPEHPQILIASPCSGHGFKFAPVIGEVLADLATVGATRHDISRFRIDRFSRNPADLGP
jgi:sarcosine oxidase